MPTLEEEFCVEAAWIPDVGDMAKHSELVACRRREYAAWLMSGGDPRCGGLFDPDTATSSTFNVRFLWLPDGAVARFAFRRPAEAFALMLPDEASVLALYPQARSGPIAGGRIRGLGVMWYVFSTAAAAVVEARRLKFLAQLGTVGERFRRLPKRVL